MKNEFFSVNKLHALPIAMVCLSCVLASCKDEAEGRITIDDTPPQQVKNISHSSLAGDT